MIKNTIISILIICTHFCVHAQKPGLAIEDLTDPPKAQVVSISNNGDYVLYSINTKRNASDLFLYSRKKLLSENILTKQRTILAAFSASGKLFAFLKGIDSLFIYDLDTHQKKFLGLCTRYQFINDGSRESIAFITPTKHLYFYDVNTEDLKQEAEASEIIFDDKSKVLLVRHQFQKDTVACNKLDYCNLKMKTKQSIWNGPMINHICFDASGKNVAFMAKTNYSESAGEEIWTYDGTSSTPELLTKTNAENLPAGITIASPFPLKLGAAGKKVFFYVSKKESVPPINSQSAKVDIWDYKDNYLQTEQFQNLSSVFKNIYLATIDIETKKIVVLENEDDAKFTSVFNSGANDNYLLTQTSFNAFEPSRLPDSLPKSYLVNTSNGARKIVVTGSRKSIKSFSPGGRFIVWYDASNRKLFTYNVASKSLMNVTSSILAQLPENEKRDFEFGLWADNDEYIYINDTYDIWKVDPAGQKPAVNITNGFGRRTKTLLRFVYAGQFQYNTNVPKGSDVYLCGFNELTKKNAFFKINLSKNNSPLKLSESSKIFYFPDNISYVTLTLGRSISKAQSGNTYIVSGMAATDYPNLHLTRDFSTFTPITSLQPQKKYNWLTAELLNWKSTMGHNVSGILYKPENFDSTRKYPVVVYIYGNLSEGINKFPALALSGGILPVPLFVSNGYIVFCPDIKTERGKAGLNAYDYVVSGVKALSDNSWIDNDRIGIQGHSFGGFETNYLITRTNIFAAAASAAGPTNYISAAGTLRGNVNDAHDYQKEFQPNLGVTFWENLDVYLENSPIFGADKVQTPLLMMHNKLDVAVPWSQGIEFYTALRYLGKTAWLLQYDDSGHELETEADKLDYTIRLKQFFDHYLKNQPAPAWMTQGRPAALKQIDDRFELDPAGSCGKDCKICKAKKYDIQTLN